MKALLKSGMGVLAAAWMMQAPGLFAQQPPPPAPAGQAAGQVAGQPPAGRQGGGGRGGGGRGGNVVVPLEDRAGFTSMFDGSSLKGWDGDPTFWRVENGLIVGESTPEKVVAENTFLIYSAAEPANFELKFEFKMNSTNSGVQYRSKRLTGAVNKWAMCGYQADFDFNNQYTGMLYEERGRQPFLAPRGTINYAPPNPDKHVQGQCTLNAPVVARAGGPGGRGQGGAAGAAGGRGDAAAGAAAGGGRAAGAAPPAAAAPATPPPPPPPAPPARQLIGQLEDGEAMKQYVKVNDWNTFHVIARGNTLIHILNGKVSAIFIDDDETNRALKGSIGIQIHVGPPMKLELRNLGLKVLP